MNTIKEITQDLNRLQEIQNQSSLILSKCLKALKEKEKIAVKGFKK